MPLLAGDRVRTQNGRVEILFADGSTLHLDANTLVDFQSDEVDPAARRPRAAQHPRSGADRRVAYRVDAPFGLGRRSSARRVPDFGPCGARHNDGREAKSSSRCSAARRNS